MNKTKNDKIVNIIIIFLLALIVVSGIVGVNCYIEQYENIYRTKELTSQLEEEQNNGKKLRIEYEKKTNIKEVEEYAVNVLGLQKYSNYQVEYISVQNANKTVFFQKDPAEENIVTRVSAVFSIISEYFN